VWSYKANTEILADGQNDGGWRVGWCAAVGGWTNGAGVGGYLSILRVTLKTLRVSKELMLLTALFLPSLSAQIV
jgi:hypothetical protein